jgi:hypothetical protein
LRHPKSLQHWNDFSLRIAAVARHVGCAQTLTFDRKAPRIPGFALA